MMSGKKFGWASVWFLLVLCLFPLSAMADSYAGTQVEFTLQKMDYAEVLTGPEAATSGKGTWIVQPQGFHGMLYSTFSPPWVPEGQWKFLADAFHKIYGMSQSRKWADAR